MKNPFKRKKKNYAPASQTGFRMLYERGNSFYGWDGKIYNSDIVRACVRPKVKALGKMQRKHLRITYDKEGKMIIHTNPEPYMSFLLSDPNPYMTGQKLIEKMAMQLALNNNAFAVILRDVNGFPVELYPVNCMNCEAVYSQSGALSLRFLMPNGSTFEFSYDDVIHIKNDFNSNDIFGDSSVACITSLMDIVTTSDQGIVHAIKNSSVIKWLLKFNSSMRDEDIKRKTKEFAENFLDVSQGTGVAAVDAKADAQQVTNSDYVPETSQLDKTTQRIYSYFNTNEQIVQSTFNEDEWNAYYESVIEPDAIAFQEEFTRKLFTRRERSCGNKIVFDSSGLTTASMKTKLNLVQLVDRSIMNANEVRAVFNLSPRDGGDEYVLRKDTGIVGGEEE